MPNATLRANARTLPGEALRLRARLAAAAQSIIDALDALDEPDMDREDDDPAEDGGDFEPSLGATEAIDQRIAWHGGPACLPVDGEAMETADDLEVHKSPGGREADRRAARSARDQLRQIFQRRRPAMLGAVR